MAKLTILISHQPHSQVLVLAQAPSLRVQAQAQDPLLDHQFKPQPSQVQI